MIFSEFYLTPKQLEGLKQYKYSAVTNSIIDHSFLPAFWDWIQVRLPRSLSPNLITLFGFFINVFGFTPLICYSTGLEEQRPIALLLLAVVCSFIYNTCDNLDGKHARALGVGSVVGELFDHGLDSMANVFQLFPVVMALELIKLDFYSVLLLFLMTDTYSLLFFSRKLAIGKLEFQAVDTTEMQYTSFLGILLTVVFGYSFWDIAIPVSLPPPLPVLSFRLVFGVCGAFPLLSNSLLQLYQQLSSKKASNVYYVFFHCAVIWLIAFAFFTLIPTAQENCMPYYMILSGLYSKLITETVFNSTGTCPELLWIRTEYLAPVLLFVNVNLKIMDATVAAWIGACFTVLLWFVYFAFVVYKSARYLGLPILTVPKKKL